MNEDIVFYNNQELTWDKFKSQFFNEHQWNLDQDENKGESLNQNQMKNVLIWNFIGKKICEYYNGLDISIKFRKADGKVRRV